MMKTIPNEIPEDAVMYLVNTLTGEHLRELLHQAIHTPVSVTMPKFESGMEVGLNEALEEMGITRAFDGAQSDLSGLGTCAGEHLLVSRMLHKTYISVAEPGIRAGAATAVEVNGESISAPDKFIEVALNRPFVYLLVDLGRQMPLFLGTVMEV